MELLSDNNLIITTSSNKEYLIKKLSSLDRLINVRIMTLKEFMDNYYFSYNEETIYYLMNKYNLKYDISKILINNMYYIDKTYNNTKIDDLYNKKEELISNNLLLFNENFTSYLNSKNIIVYNTYLPNILKDKIKYEEVIDSSNDYTHEIVKCNSLDSEVEYVASEICRLIKNNVDINNIYLTNLNDEYRLIIKRVFNMFNININLKDNRSIYSTNLVNKFIELYEEDLNNTLTKLKENIKDSEIDIYNKIVSIVNKYVSINDRGIAKEMIISDIKNTKLSSKKYTNSVNEVDTDYIFSDNDYVFLLGFNQGVIPVLKKDEDYLSDKDKKILNIETSTDINEIEKNKIINWIKNIKNLYITYKLKSLTDTYTISNINDELNYSVIDSDISLNNSNLYNEIKLVSDLDLFNKYGVVNPNLKLLYSNYKDINYRVYDNKFTGVDKELLYKYLDNKLLLSYSSLDNYHRCGFRYYLGNILKLNIYEDTFMQMIGNLFHYVLSLAFTPNFNYDECFDNYINKELSKKEEFFIKKLKEELRFIIDTIKEHNTHSSLDKELYEEKIYVNMDGNIKVSFMGIIDKLKYKEIDDKYVVAIIDYKTGNPNLNLNNVIYGIEMQLPIYIYLARNKFDKQISVAGFYLQKILNNEIVADHTHTYEELKRKNLLLQGYSNENTSILNYFDDTYTDSSVVKSLKTSNKGFYAYSKIINEDTLNRLVSMTEEKIIEAKDNILEANFTINPKKIGNKNLGCEFCKFNDICYHSEKDIVSLKEYKDLSFLGGEEDGLD